MEGLTEGRIVHYVLSNGERRPAIVVKVWSPSMGTANLCVFMDGHNDSKDGAMTRWVTSAMYSEDPKPDTWHWIERA